MWVTRNHAINKFDLSLLLSFPLHRLFPLFLVLSTPTPITSLCRFPPNENFTTTYSLSASEHILSPAAFKAKASKPKRALTNLYNPTQSNTARRHPPTQSPLKERYVRLDAIIKKSNSTKITFNFQTGKTRHPSLSHRAALNTPSSHTTQDSSTAGNTK